MEKVKTALLILFIVGVIGAFNSITSQSQVSQEKGFVNGVLSLLGLTYKPPAVEPRNFDYVPTKITSEVTRITPDSLKSTPSAEQKLAQGESQTSASPQAQPQPEITISAPSPSPEPASFNPYFSQPPIPPVAPNQTLGVKTENLAPTPPVPPFLSGLNPVIDSIVKTLLGK